jgi:hypothetical protein
VARALVVVILLMAATAQAGNEDSVSLGGDASLMGGCGLAVTGQATAAWYNPAGLARLDATTLDVSASMYSVTYRTLDGAAVTALPWGTLRSSGRTTDFTSVPSTVAAGYQLRPRLGLGLGVFVPNRRDFGFSATDRSSGLVAEQPTNYEQTFFMHGTSERSYFGGAMGLQLADWLSLGVSLFAVRDQLETTFQLAAGLHRADDPMAQQGAFGVISAHDEHQVFGLRSAGGIQAEVDQGLTLAALVWTPVISVFDFGKLTTIAGVTNRLPTGQSMQSLEVNSLDRQPRAVYAPFRATAGIAYTPANWHLTGEIDFRSRGRHGFDESFETVWNARVGMLRALTGSFWLGAGLFSDRSDRPIAESDNSDYYGVTTGLKYRPKRLRERSTRDRGWDILAIIGLRYTYGTGRVRIFSLSADPSNSAAAPGSIDGRLREHMLQLQLGTSLAY